MDANIKELSEQELDQVAGGFLFGGCLLGTVINTKVNILSGILSIFNPKTWGGKTGGSTGCDTGCDTGCAPVKPRC
ncbi:MAG: bacteriocin [Paracoccus sp. (in: a-proteobacteria)]|uniref:bacteriocin n=1 Tax=Paracoccus sp. TaxID=267 RepID=UPI0026DF4477|nr:bacteriocin [Paracoccus sp. (in: a-proteobacteria)]MDO5614016.1 bacteriocin [Paracoccus sp. (in: a-proteobacteria)]